jgi:hypothetical protein
MIRKNYVHAERRFHQHYMVNVPLEGVYHHLLRSIKQMLATLPDEKDRTVIELNRKHDSTSVFGMHEFLAPSIYFSLECDHFDRYQIYYAFNNFTFKAQVEAKFKHCSLHSRLQVKELTPDFDSFYKNAIAYQPSKHISVLGASQL